GIAERRGPRRSRGPRLRLPPLPRRLDGSPPPGVRNVLRWITLSRRLFRRCAAVASRVGHRLAAALSSRPSSVPRHAGRRGVRHAGLLLPPHRPAPLRRIDCGRGHIRKRTLIREFGRGRDVIVVRQWSGRETRALRDAKRMSIREFAAHLGVHERLVSKWEAGGSRVHPRPVNQAALDTSLARSDEVVRARFAALIDQPLLDAGIAADTGTAQAGPSGSASDADLLALIGSGAIRSAALASISERDLIMAAAHEASDHVGRAESTNVGANTLEQLDADVVRIANDYVHEPPVPMTVEMLRVRRRVYRLLEGHQRPADTRHLYLLAGTLTGLLANASTDLGYLDAAAEQVRAAWAYAELCDHNALRAWTRGMHALIECRSQRPRRAVLLAQSGQEYAESATARVRLFNIEARMWATLGDTAETDRCVRAAEEAGTRGAADDLHDEIGGVFGFPDAKAQYYAGTTYIHLGQAEQALAATSRAIELYASGPQEK